MPILSLLYTHVPQVQVRVWVGVYEYEYEYNDYEYIVQVQVRVPEIKVLSTTSLIIASRWYTSASR